ncbi:MAG TPA: hypothetical protein VNI83_01405, partial [Vicinamibacterales bacterium]|nr:hypothetical protein [Vicinamibacterales bacterium]
MQGGVAGGNPEREGHEPDDGPRHRTGEEIGETADARRLDGAEHEKGERPDRQRDGGVLPRHRDERDGAHARERRARRDDVGLRLLPGSANEHGGADDRDPADPAGAPEQTELGELVPVPALGVVGRQADPDRPEGVIAHEMMNAAHADSHPGMIGDHARAGRPVAVAGPEIGHRASRRLAHTSPEILQSLERPRGAGQRGRSEGDPRGDGRDG